MVIDNFNIPRFLFSPREAHSPLVIYSDAILSGTITAHGLKAIARRHTQIIDALCSVKGEELFASSLLHFVIATLHNKTRENRRRPFISEGSDHMRTYRGTVRSVKSFTRQ